MGLKEDIIDIRKEVNEVKEQSLAWEMLRDSKKSNKVLTSILFLVLILWSITICYLVYVLNDTGTVVTTTETSEQTISDIGTMDNNQIINGDYNGNSKPKD